MYIRILTAIIGIPLLISIITLGDPILKYAVTVVALIGVHEFYSQLDKKYNPMKLLGYIAVVSYLLFLDYFYKHYIFYVAIMLIFVLICMVIKYPRYSIIDVALTIFAPMYIGVLLSFIILIRDSALGGFWIWVLIISAWGCDTFAYLTGVMLGKHKLAPLLSPKKTIEGSIGGLVGAALLAFIYAYFYAMYNDNSVQYYITISVAIFSAIVSQLGDLAASAIKRTLEIKDFGNILPGHGGILDRFDSLLIAAPTVFAIIMLLENI